MKRRLPRNPKTLFAAVGASLALSSAWCQIIDTPRARVNLPEKPEWVEQASLAPPAFSADKTMALRLPPYLSLKVGVDPDTFQLGTDDVLRYVMVVKNRSGSVYATYEGIRCATREVKTYARQVDAGKWVASGQPLWKPLAGGAATQLALLFAQQGACNDNLPNNKAEVLAKLTQTTVPLSRGGAN